MKRWGCRVIGSLNERRNSFRCKEIRNGGPAARTVSVALGLRQPFNNPGTRPNSQPESHLRWWSLSVLFDPGRIRQAEWTKSKLPDTAPACVHDEGSRRLVLSGLNHTTFDLTVYASQDGSPHHHARLASGCWSSFARRDSYPQGFNERFQSSSLFLLSKAYLTQGHHTQFFGVRYGVPGTRNYRAFWSPK